MIEPGEIRDKLFDSLLGFIYTFKSLFQLMKSPSWPPGYVSGELKKKSKGFHEYSHPINFFIITAVFPVFILIPIYQRFVNLAQGKILNLSNLFTVDFSPDAAKALNGAFKAIDALDIEFKVLIFFILLMSWPLAASLVIQLFRFFPFSRNDLKSVIYVQCYYFGALYLYVHLLTLFLFFYSEWPSPLLRFLITLPFYYFVFGEYLAIRNLTKHGILKSIGILVIVYVAGYIVMILCEIFVFIPVFFWYFSRTSNG